MCFPLLTEILPSHKQKTGQMMDKFISFKKCVASLLIFVLIFHFISTELYILHAINFVFRKSKYILDFISFHYLDVTASWYSLPRKTKIPFHMVHTMAADDGLQFHDIVTKWSFSALLALCAGNSPVTGEFPAQRPATWSFDVFFDLHLNKRLSKQSWGWGFETPSRSFFHLLAENLPCHKQKMGQMMEKFILCWKYTASPSIFLLISHFTNTEIWIHHTMDMLRKCICIYIWFYIIPSLGRHGFLVVGLMKDKKSTPYASCRGFCWRPEIWCHGRSVAELPINFSNWHLNTFATRVLSYIRTTMFNPWAIMISNI